MKNTFIFDRCYFHNKSEYVTNCHKKVLIKASQTTSLLVRSCLKIQSFINIRYRVKTFDTFHEKNLKFWILDALHRISDMEGRCHYLVSYRNKYLTVNTS